MIRPRKRPEIAGRASVELDDDLAARAAAGEAAGRDRQLIAGERPGEPAPDDAVGAVGADHERGAPRAGVGIQSYAGRVDGHVADARALENRSGSDGRREER